MLVTSHNVLQRYKGVALNMQIMAPRKDLPVKITLKKWHARNGKRYETGLQALRAAYNARPKDASVNRAHLDSIWAAVEEQCEAMRRHNLLIRDLQDMEIGHVYATSGVRTIHPKDVNYDYDKLVEPLGVDWALVLIKPELFPALQKALPDAGTWSRSFKKIDQKDKDIFAQKLLQNSIVKSKFGNVVAFYSAECGFVRCGLAERSDHRDTVVRPDAPLIHGKQVYGTVGSCDIRLEPLVSGKMP